MAKAIQKLPIIYKIHLKFKKDIRGSSVNSKASKTNKNNTKYLFMSGNQTTWTEVYYPLLNSQQGSSRPEMFYEIGVIKKNRKIHRKTPLLESVLQRATLFHKESSMCAFL